MTKAQGPDRKGLFGAGFIRKRQHLSANHEPSPALPARRIGGNSSVAIFALCAATVAGMAGDTRAQDSDQQIRCMQLQQELASAQSGGGASSALPAINKQIQDTTRVYQGTKAAMEDAGCFQSFLIFGRPTVSR